jgi:hypothetical protein
MSEVPFFDYTCDVCDAPVCERVSILNLTLDIEDSLYCLPCLTRWQEEQPAEVALSAVQVQTLRDFLMGYVSGRDCFKKPWQSFDATPCPLPRVETVPPDAEGSAQWCYCRPV